MLKHLSKKEELILKHLPDEARFFIHVRNEKNKKTAELVKKIYKLYGKDISDLAKS